MSEIEKRLRNIACESLGCQEGIAMVMSHTAECDALGTALINEWNTNFQSRVQPWMMECFGEMISGDREERNHRFLEESLELVQSLGCTPAEAHQLVDYVYGRPVGDPPQEVGGVMVTLAALCLANDMDMHEAGEVELERIWTKVEQIRAKQAAKPKHSPLPVATDEKASPRFVTDEKGLLRTGFDDNEKEDEK